MKKKQLKSNFLYSLLACVASKGLGAFHDDPDGEMAKRRAQNTPVSVKEELYYMGTACENGSVMEGVTYPKDMDLAYNCYRQSAALGFPPAYQRLGYFYYVGFKAEIHKTREKGNPEKRQRPSCRQYALKKAIKHLRNAVTVKSNIPCNMSGAMNNLATCYEELGDERRAVVWFKKAAAENNPLGCQNLGRRYIEARGVPKNEGLGVQYLMNAVQHHPQSLAAMDLVLFYDQKKETAKAVSWLRYAASGGNEKANYILGIWHRSGRGVEKSVDLSLRYVQRAAKMGYAKAQVSLASTYLVGKDVSQDFKKSFQWYLKAAQQGDRTAQHNLGILYLNGPKGVEKNQKEAKSWLEKAAMQGCQASQKSLGYMYLSGEGVEQDVQKGLDLMIESHIEAHGEDDDAVQMFPINLR